MCFSAETSFTAGVILVGAGLVLIKKFVGHKEIFLALIPLFFGIQQLSEGVLWESLEHGQYPSGYGLTAQYIFIFFAYMFWPVFIPFAFGVVEGKLWRKTLMISLMLIGLLFFLNIGFYFLTTDNIRAKILEHSISYSYITTWPYRILYAVITLAPFYLTSIKKVWILGIANTIGYIIADVSYNYAFASVWCFLAAIITIGLFILLEKKSIKTIEQERKSDS